jgi:hypothetical protein
MTVHDRALRIDRAQRLAILTAADYKCQLNYPGICSVNATEIADVGEFKAACKECRRHRDGRRSVSAQLAGQRMRRTRP